METTNQDESVNQTLQFAIERMQDAGYSIDAIINIEIDPDLQFMGYAKIDSHSSTIVIADWALDSQMLGGLILHELAHIYFTENQSPSHQQELIQEIIHSIIHSEGLNNAEGSFLTESFTHLQNILVDDLVFELLNSEKETKLVQEFFLTWMSDLPTGNHIVDASLLTRNAFAIASLKRRNIFFNVDKEMERRNEKFLSFYKIDDTDTNNSEKFIKLETFLITINLKNDSNFRNILLQYFELLLNLLQPKDIFLDKLK
ncbi:MAG: hypothetical protein CMO11_01480 [Thaumarchaeota archaeon]|nr:hypothetical protein [Nitrososphaerota archaeon]